MPSFEELRKSATAAETCLIDTVISMVEKEIRERIILKMVDYVRITPLPNIEGGVCPGEVYLEYYLKLREHLSSSAL